MAARKSRRRKGAARRKSRRAAARVVHHNAPRKARRRGRAHARRNSPRHARRRGSRRNPGLVSGLMRALGDGVKVSGGQLVQNAVVTYVPDLLPATMSNAAVLNPLIKDLFGVVAGAYGADKILGADAARLVVAGQASAAINRLLRNFNVPVVTPLLGVYDPRLGTYSTGIVRPVAAARTIAKPNNVAMLKGVGIYTDGMSSSPSLF